MMEVASRPGASSDRALRRAACLASRLARVPCFLSGLVGVPMAREDAVLALGPDGALGVFQETGAVAQCPNHPEIFVRAGDAAAEQRAYALANDRLSHLPPDERQAARNSMASSLASTANRRCPLCAAESR